MHWPFWERHFVEGMNRPSCLPSLARPETFLKFVKKVNNVYHVSLYVPTPPPVLPKTQLSTVTIKFLHRGDLLVYVIH